jgi:hypothetical protein
MNAIANRPENRRRDGLDVPGLSGWEDLASVCYRSEAFAEDLGDAATASSLPRAAGERPAPQATWWRLGHPLPLLHVAVAGMLVVLGR